MGINTLKFLTKIAKVLHNGISGGNYGNNECFTS